MLAFLLLELVMLTCVWWAYQAPDTLFGTKLELVQQEELFTSMWNYFLSIVTFALVWYNGRWNPLCGGVCLCIWTAFVTFGHESTAKAFDALFYLAKTWTMSPVKPFEFSSGTEVRWSFILKVSLQCAYVVFLFICYKTKDVYFMGQPLMTNTTRTPPRLRTFSESFLSGLHPGGRDCATSC